MRRKKIILITCAMGLLCSCQSGEGLPGANPETPGARTAPFIIESVTEAGIEPSADGATRADAGTRAAIPVESGSIGVFLADATPAGGNYEPRYNACYTYDTDNSAWTSNDALFFNEGDAYVCAYYPYDDTQTDSKHIVLTSQAYTAAKDLSFATNETMNATDNTVSFNMDHAYALLELHLKRENIKDDLTFKQIDVIASGLTKSTTVNITDGTFSTTPVALEEGKLSMPLDPVLTLSKNTSSTVHKVLIVPTETLTGGTKLTFTLDDDDSTTMSVTIAGLTRYEKKKRYIANLTINGTDVVVKSVKVAAWTELSLGSEDAPYIPEI